MSVPRIRLETVEAIARKILMEYDSSLLSGEPRPIPIEAIIEVKFDLILEYHILRKNGAVLGETIFDDGPVILYDMDERSYKIIAVRKGTILIDERLCETRSIGRLRFQTLFSDQQFPKIFFLLLTYSPLSHCRIVLTSLSILNCVKVFSYFC